MKTDDLSNLDKKLPDLFEVSAKFFSGTLRKLSDIQRRKSQELPLSKLSSFKKTSITMKPCWPTCESDFQRTISKDQNTLPRCKYCLEPSSSIIKSESFNITRERQSTEPVSVPDGSSTEPLNNEQPPPQQSLSSGYESPFGNELSPTKSSWTLGIEEYLLSPPSTCDDLSSDQDQSVFDESSTTDGPDEADVDDDSFEVLSFDAPPESSLYIREFQHTTSNSQNNVCDCCNAEFTSIPNGSARRCHYYGKLYCSQCHILDYACIPAKIIKSFDIHRYPVCRRAKSVLQSNFYQPVFDIQNDNEKLYVIHPMLSEVKAMRTRFQNFYAYLSTCTRIENDLNEKFLKEFYARDYLYQSIHLYSLNDLLSLKEISDMLQRVIDKAKKHVCKCAICRGKGFMCEICKNRSDILYPFSDAKRIERCDHCSNIYHRKCWDHIDHDCPKCYRIIQRKQEQDDI